MTGRFKSQMDIDKKVCHMVWHTKTTKVNVKEVAMKKGKDFWVIMAILLITVYLLAGCASNKQPISQDSSQQTTLPDPLLSNPSNQPLPNQPNQQLPNQSLPKYDGPVMKTETETTITAIRPCTVKVLAPNLERLDLGVAIVNAAAASEGKAVNVTGSLDRLVKKDHFAIVAENGNRTLIQVSDKLLKEIKVKGGVTNPASNLRQATLLDVCPNQAKRAKEAIAKCPSISQRTTQVEVVRQAENCPTGFCTPGNWVAAKNWPNYFGAYFDLVFISDQTKEIGSTVSKQWYDNGGRSHIQVVVYNGDPDPYLYAVAVNRARCLYSRLGMPHVQAGPANATCQYWNHKTASPFPPESMLCGGSGF